jgi:hypothetical protein
MRKMRENRKPLVIFVALVLLSLLWVPQVEATTNCTFITSGTTMTLTADCNTDETIFIPDGSTLDGAGHTITATDPPSDHFKGAVVQNAGSTAHIKNLTITTSGLSNTCDDGDDRLRGILFEGAGGSITDNQVNDVNQGTGSGCQEGNGIEVRNTPFDGTHPNTKTVTIAGNTVSNYQKNGITANGDVVATITANTVTGLGPVNFIAQNGIQMGFGARGKIRNNTVAASWFSGANWTASGILIFESDDVIAQQNDISGNQSGIVVETWCWFAPSAHNNKIQNNTIKDAEFGISVSALVLGGFSTCDSAANNNKVVNNTVASSSGEIGIFVGAGFAFDGESTGFTPSADNNKLINNDISGFSTDIEDEGTASKVHANTSIP